MVRLRARLANAGKPWHRRAGPLRCGHARRVRRSLALVARVALAALGALAGLAALDALVSCAPARADRAVDGEAILRTYCVRCHSGPRARGDFDFVANTSQLIARGFVVPGDAAHS